MFAQLTRWFSPDDTHIRANRYYIALVARARNPFFYADLLVPDTLDGRFDMVLLHLALLTQRLQQEGEQTQELRRALSEIFIQDMDQNLREMGVSDTGVSKRMKRMIQAYYGRLVHYEEALASPENLAETLRRNVYGTLEEIDEVLVEKLVHYMQQSHAALQAALYDELSPDTLPFAPLG